MLKPTLKKILIASVLSSSLFGAAIIPSYATVGGGQTIEVLGYENSDKKLFVLRHYEDGRGRLPQIYYYDFNSKNPQKLVEVRSIYLNPQTNQYDEFDDTDTFFNARLERIKQRLTILKTINSPNSIEVVDVKHKRVPAWLGGNTYEYTFSYRVLSHDEKSSSDTQKLTSYGVFLSSDSNVYSIPNQPYTLTKVTYTGTDMEMRYSFEDPVLMKAN